jgi:restriction system protein
MEMTFLEAAERILGEAGGPLHYREITRRALACGYLESHGKTPEATMYAQIVTAIKSRGDACVFARVAPGTVALRAALGSAAVSVEPRRKAYVPFFPSYDETRAVLPTWAGARPGDITGMRAAIYSLTGTPQDPVTWSDPDQWIPERLSGADREWALKTWVGSHRKVNPRHCGGHWLLISNYGLLEEGPEGRLSIGDRGRQFLEEPSGRIVQEIDEQQGLVKLLAIVADSGGASRGQLLEPWKDFLLKETNVRADSSAKSHLYYRLLNLEDRGFLERTGTILAITPAGLDYLGRLGGVSGADSEASHRIRQLLREQQQEVRESIRDLLSEMDPHAFEGLIKQLLQDIGYENVEVTSPSNDKGVDVVADIELGITSVREVVQVKRHAANVQRPVLDALRGVLHRFRAVRGTIITTGGFSKGTQEAAFEHGAAPITLIDGEKLVDLLIEHDMGVKKRTMEIWELDPSAFSGTSALEVEET